VIILDPHSDVSTALLDRVVVDDAAHYFHNYVLAELGTEMDAKDLVIFFPDNGAMKRYSDGFSGEYERTYGSKNRDWRSGKILGYEIINPEVVKDKNVLIVDDICSYGGTFYHAAKALKAAGAKNIYLAVTHAENSMISGDMYNTEGLVDTIYTTNSIFNPAVDYYHKVVTMLI
jgi:ribose-phosphate pyrophosphokinase